MRLLLRANYQNEIPPTSKTVTSLVFLKKQNLTHSILLFHNKSRLQMFGHAIGTVVSKSNGKMEVYNLFFETGTFKNQICNFDRGEWL